MSNIVWKLMQVNNCNSSIKEKHFEWNFQKEKKMLPGSADSFPVWDFFFFLIVCCVCHTSCESILSLVRRFCFFPPQPGLMQSTTVLATLGDFSCHRRQTTDHFWSWEMLFWARAPPMLTQIWPKEAPRLFTDPVRCRESGSPARLGIDKHTTQLV